MTISKQRVTCKCGHVFDAELVTNAPLAVSIASMQAVRCPKCGSTEVGLGGSYDDAPPLTSSVEQRAAWWRDRGETGRSSLTIWCAFTGGQKQYVGYPYDPTDFRRCKQLLDLIPEWRSQLSVVTDRFPWFQPFISRWAAFEAMYEAEAASGFCHKLYDEMQIACKEAGEIRRKGMVE